MALLTQKENNESYTIGQMIKQKDAADFIHMMIEKLIMMRSAIIGKLYIVGKRLLE